MKNSEKAGTFIIPTVCATHCGGTCVLRVHVEDGKIKRVETDNGAEPQLRACMRGRALRQRVYSPDRILYPMKRTGERGEGTFERITWDEALDTVATRLKHVKETFGPEAILYAHSGGDLVSLNFNSTVSRLLAMAGGFSDGHGIASYQGGMFAAFLTYGTVFCSNTRDDLLNSRLIVMWGWDPATTITGTNTPWFLARAREGGTRIIAVDPYCSDSAATFAEQWIPIRPGTDTAMLIAMACVMIRQELQDTTFLDRYTIGFDRFRAYVMGEEDGVPKTPLWAESITGVPAATIEKLARDYATTKPAAFMAGIAPGRSAFGEQYHRATITLAAMTGNVGVHGGDAAAMAWGSTRGGYPYGSATGGAVHQFQNPLERPKPGVPVVPTGEIYPSIHFTKVADAILTGRQGGYPADYKFLFIVSTNYLNTLPNINKIVKALKTIEFIVIEEQYMTPTARYADIILPTTTFVERDDIALGVGMAYIGFQRKIIEPLGACKAQNEIAKELAKRLGIADYDTRDGEEHLKEVAERLHIPDYEKFKEKGVHWIERTEPYVALKAQIEDPENNPFPTPSGKIEIYSQQIADMNNPLLPPIPQYIEPWESITDPLADKYPIQLVTKHAKRRANAQFDTVPWLKERIPQAITMNASDARARGIHDGDMVRVFNDRGETMIPAQLTERIMPGVAILPAGAWYAPDEKGIDRGGSANVLTRDEPSPGGAFPYNTALIQIEKTDVR
ncbi:MAG: molybdopterin-dependent oxidoreductase [Pseudomonadota bacterium]